jgi:hypothetical protein
MNKALERVPDVLEIRVFNHFMYNGVVVTVHGIKHEYKTDTVIVQKTGSYFYCYCTRWELKTLALTDGLIHKLGFKGEKFERGNIWLQRTGNGYNVTAHHELKQADIYLANITHVHTLQNLYYDLFKDHVMFWMGIEVELV